MSDSLTHSYRPIWVDSITNSYSPIWVDSVTNSYKPIWVDSLTHSYRPMWVRSLTHSYRLICSHDAHTIRTIDCHTGPQCTFQLVYQPFYQHFYEFSCGLCSYICSADYQSTWRRERFRRNLAKYSSRQSTTSLSTDQPNRLFFQLHSAYTICLWICQI